MFDKEEANKRIFEIGLAINAIAMLSSNASLKNGVGKRLKVIEDNIIWLSNALEQMDNE